MADIHYRDPHLLNAAGDGPADMLLVAVDNGDGTYNLSVSTASEPAPSNYALEAGGNLDDLLTLIGTKADAAVTDPTTTTASLFSLFKGMVSLLVDIKTNTTVI